MHISIRLKGLSAIYRTLDVDDLRRDAETRKWEERRWGSERKRNENKRGTLQGFHSLGDEVPASLRRRNEDKMAAMRSTARNSKTQPSCGGIARAPLTSATSYSVPNLYLYVCVYIYIRRWNWRGTSFSRRKCSTCLFSERRREEKKKKDEGGGSFPGDVFQHLPWSILFRLRNLTLVFSSAFFWPFSTYSDLNEEKHDTTGSNEDSY